MESRGRKLADSPRALGVRVVTTDAGLLPRFTDAFQIRPVTLQEATTAPEHLKCRVILLDVREQHCHLQAAHLATRTDLAVVVLARAEDTTEAMRYLDVGVTDVLWSSMTTVEMQARIRAAARYVSAVQDDWLTSGPIAISVQRQEVRKDGQVVNLTPTEYRVLEALVAHPDETVSHQSIMGRVWGPELLTARHYLRVYIRQLREKLEADPSSPRIIMTDAGDGYRLSTDQSAADGRRAI